MKFLKFSKLFGAGWNEKKNKRSAKSTKRPAVQLRLEELEDRLAPSVTPILPEVLVSDPMAIGVGYSPQVVINPVDPLKMVEVHATGGALAGSYTNDGGQTWQPFGLAGNIPDPNLANAPFTAADTPSVAFDMNELFYVASVQHDAANTSGAVVVQTFSFGGSRPTQPGVTKLLAPPGYTPPPVYTLTASLGDDTIEVESFAGFPKAGLILNDDFSVRIDGEEMRVVDNTDASGNYITTWRVVRAVNGTALAAHNLNASITYLDPTAPVGDLGSPNIVYRWFGDDPAFNTYIAIDTNPAVFTDPETGEVQLDSLATTHLNADGIPVPKAIYVAFNVDTRQPTRELPGGGGNNPPTISKIMVVASADGGDTYTTMQRLGNSDLTGIGDTPQILFTQGEATTATTMNDPGGISASDTTMVVTSSAGFPSTPFSITIDGEVIQVTNVNTGTNTWTISRTPASAVAHANGAVIALNSGNKGGLLTFIWNNFQLTGSTPPPPTRVMMDQTQPDGGVPLGAAAATQNFTSAGGGVTDGSRPAAVTTTNTANVTATQNFVFVPLSTIGVWSVGNNFTTSGDPSEQMRISGISNTTTTVTTLSSPGAIPPATETLTVVDSGIFLVGDLIRISAEEMIVTAINGSELTIRRAQNGTTATVHGSNSTVENRTRVRWTVNRAQAGTTAVTHGAGATFTMVDPVDITGVTNFTQFVGITEANLTSINDLDVTINLRHPNVDEIEVDLIAPDGTVIRLVRNRTNNDGNPVNAGNPSARGLAAGTDVGVLVRSGITNSAGTTFDQDAERFIAGDTPVDATINPANSYVGHFRPENGSLDVFNTAITRTGVLAASPGGDIPAGASTTLTSSITSSQTTMQVASSAGFPATPFTVQIGVERVRVTNVSGTTWTISRSFNGSSDNQPHLSGSAVSLVDFAVNIQVGALTFTPPPTPFVVKIGDELMTVTGVLGSTWSVTRAQGTTLAPAHAGGSTINYLSATNPNTNQPTVSINGNWTLRISDHRFSGNQPVPTQFLVNWSLHFSGVMSADGFGTDTLVLGTNSTLPSSTTNVYPTTNAAAGTNGISPGVSIAQDKTLGGFSQYQGRIYMAYVPFGSTNIRLISSDDNGASWDFRTIVNDDSIADGFSEGNRHQFAPTVAVDPVTGTVVISYFDARNDAANTRVALSVVASIDGGDTFSPVAYANPMKTATDFLTGELLDIGPVPGNQTNTNFGSRQGLIVQGGRITPVYSSNLDAPGVRSIMTSTISTAAGPRVIFGDMGTVTADFTSETNTTASGTFFYNNTLATDGTRRLDGFVVQFDRPVNVSTFSAADVVVKYQNPNTGAFTDIPLAALNAITPLDMPTSSFDDFGPRGVGIGTLATTFYVRFATPQTNLGAYSYAIGPNISDKLRTFVSTITPTAPSPPFNAPFNSTDVPRAIPDLQVVTSSLTVPALPSGQVVSTVTVTLDITHTYVGDLEITLISPSGTRVILSDNNGGSSDNFVNVTFSDSATTSITVASTPYANATYAPQTAFAALAGESSGGVWQLEIADQVGTDSGTLNSWSLTVTPGTVTTIVDLGNEMDQNANTLTNEPVVFASSLTTTIDMPPFGLTKTAKTMEVTSSVGWPATPFVVQIEDEQVLVTDVVGTTWTIDRGWNGTESAAHANGTVINSVNAPDIFSVPTALPTNNVSPITGVPFSGKYDPLTLPLVIPGAHIVSTTIPGATVATTTVAATGLNPFGVSEFATTVNVASSASFPATGGFAARIGNESVWVNSISGNTWSITRGFHHTTPSAHAVGTKISVGDAFDNLVLNNTVSSIDVTFDRDINPATFTSADIVSLLGPAGAITGPITVTQPAAGNNRLFRISFPTQTLSGSYSVVIGSQIADSFGNLVDNNLNVGVNVLRGVSDPQTGNVTLTRPVYGADPFAVIPASGSVSTTISIADAFNILQATTQNQFTDGQTTNINQAGGLTATATTMTVVSTVGFPSNPGSNPFTVLVGTEQIRVTGVSGLTWTILRGQNGTTPAAHNNGDLVRLGKTATIQLMLNIGPDGANNLDIRDLSATLTAPDGTVVTIFNNVGNVGSGSRTTFSNTTFDDTATTPIQTASVPITVGPFNPQSPLTALDGKNVQGNWTLTITNNGNHNAGGVLNHWELRLPRATPTSGLGEPVGDRSTTNFRIFTAATTDPQSYTQWTAVGPSGNTINPDFNGDNAGSVSAIAVDPSDPSGNTVYIGAASGGIWKTANYLTSDSSGPTWIPLTDLGPSSSLNIGSLAAIGRNSDPTKTIIIATTGNGTDTTTQSGSPGNSTTTTAGALGAGFLRSMDGGQTWQVLDSLTNVDAGLQVLPMNSPTRDHWFVGSTGNKIVADPTPQANGHIVLYAAISDNTIAARNGLYRSLDTGNTWVKMSTGNANDRATDVVLAPASGNTTGLLTVLYAAFEGDGVYEAVGNATQTTTLAKMNGGGIFISRVDLDGGGLQQLTTAPPVSTPNGAKGDIALATPMLTNSPLGDSFYQRWLYAAVATATGSFDGLYVTKDGGENWTKVNLPSFFGFGTNNESRTNFDPGTGDSLVSQSLNNYTLTLTVDPNDPNVVYLGGTNGGSGSVFRIDITKLEDPYALIRFSHDEVSGLSGSDGPTPSGDGSINIKPVPPDSAPWFAGISSASPYQYGVVNQFDPFYNQNDRSTWTAQAEYYNLYREPTNPFRPATLQFANLDKDHSFAWNNRGWGVSWVPLNGAIDVSENQHQIVAIKDAITGGTRLYFANDYGVYTGVNSDGVSIESVGEFSVVTGSRNGNLQIAQMYDGAAQPSTLAADLAGALFYGSTEANGVNPNAGISYPQSSRTILTTGDTRWRGISDDGIVNGNVLTTGRVTDGAGVVTDQGGLGQVYNFIYPSTIEAPFVPTDLFQVTAAATATAAYIGGLIQPGDVPGLNQGQWPEFQGSNFAVNPIDANSAVMASKDGRLFLTSGNFSGGGANITWTVIATPAELGNTSATNNVSAVAFGSRNLTTNEPSDLIYAGTESGRIFVTFTAGGFYEISTGLDGSPIQQIVTNPKSGSYELYAVTTTGVFWMQNAQPLLNAQGGVIGVNAQARWLKISDLTGATTTVNMPGSAGPPVVPAGLTATATMMTVTSNTGFPTTTPFLVRVDNEIIRVTDATSTTWTIERGANGTTPAAHANAANVTELRHQLFTLSKGNFNNNLDQIQTLEYLTSLQIDWRYAVPDSGTAPTTTLAAAISSTDTTLTVPASAATAGFPAGTFVIQIGSERIQVTAINGTTWTIVRGFEGTSASAHLANDEIEQINLTHPVLYVAGEGGVFRSRDNGINWSYFPNVADDGAAQEGGYLPNVSVTALDLVLGNVNSSTGFSDPSTGLNMLLATTYGRGQFAIRLDNSDIAQYAVAPVSGPRITSQTNVFGPFGQTLNGVSVTFGGAVDPATFTPADVVVTAPGGANVAIASVVDISTGGAHNVFQINFASPQSVTGNYTIRVGPAVLDFSGSQMNQDNDNLNGENPSDAYFNTFNFTANNPPTISNITDKVVTPNQLSNWFAFTISDAETPVGSLVLTATSSNQTVMPNANIQVQNLGGGNAQIRFNVPNSHGAATITVTVTDGSGSTAQDTFLLNVSIAPTVGSIANQSVAHGAAPLTVNLNANDADGDQLTFTVDFHDPLADVASTFGLYDPELTQYFNYRGANEKYLQSNNGSNAAFGGFYILLPTNKLYAWQGSMSATLAAAPVADFTTSTYANVDIYGNPALLTSFDPLATLRTTYGLNTAGQYFNFRGAGEWYFSSSNGSNAANGGWYVLMPSNKLYAWNSVSIASTVAGTPVADFLTPAYSNHDVYNNPLKLMSLGARTDDPFVTVSSPLYELKTQYGFDTAAQYFNYRGANEWYLQSSNGWNRANGGWFMLLPNNTLVAWDGSAFANGALVADLSTYGSVYANPALLTGAKLTTTAALSASAPQYTPPPAGGTLTITPHPDFERSVLVTVTATDPFGASSTPQSFTYAVTNSAPTVASQIGDRSIPHNQVSDSFNASANFSDPGETDTYSVEVNGYNGTSAVLAEISGRYGLTTADVTSYFNFRGANEKYFQSSNTSNAGNGGYYVLMPDNKLYAWDGVSIASMTAGGANSPFFVADFLAVANVYGNTALLYNALKALPPAVAVNQGPLYDVRTQFGLNNADLTTFFNVRGQSEKYFQSTNGSNAANGGYYILMPNGALLAWNSSSLATSPQVADLSTTNAYLDTRLLYQAQPAFINDAAYAAKSQFGLNKADETAYFNFRGANEKYFQSTNGSNAANGGYFVLMPNGNLYAFIPTPGNNLSLASTLAQAPVATLGAAVYTDTFKLYSSTGQVLGVTATVSNAGQVTLTRNTAFSGTVRVIVAATDGARKASQSFLFTVSNIAPTFAVVNNVSGTSASQGTTINLGATDGNGDAIQYAASVSNNPLYLLKTQYAFNTAAQYFNFRGANEWYFQSSNGSNSANGGWYVLMPNNMLYAWDGASIASTTARAPVADFTSSLYGNVNVYATPSLLNNATTTNLSLVGTPTFTGGNLNLTWSNTFAGQFLVTVFIWDGVAEMQRTFLVTVTP